MAKNLYNLTAVTTVNDSDLLHVNQGSVSSDKKVTKQNLLKEVNSSITSLNNSLTQCLTTTPGIITSGRDLNDYKSNGLYIIQSGVTNSPSSWCALLVIGTPTTYGVHQIAFSFSAFYVRSYTGSPMAWTNWRSLTFS